MLALLAMLHWAAPPATACGAGRPHRLSEREIGVDVEPPPAPTTHLHQVRRGTGGVRVGELIRKTCSDGDGAIALAVDVGADDRTPPDSIGYRVSYLSGRLPDGLRLPQTQRAFDLSRRAADARSPSWVVFIRWVDGRTHLQEPFDFLAAVHAVDLAGNVSIEADTVRIHHPGAPHREP